MSMHRLGETRSRRAVDHLLQTPDTFVWSPLPGMVKSTACVHASPQIGSGFTQYTATFEAGGALGDATGSRLVFVLEGTVQCLAGDRTATLGSGGYAYLPQGQEHTITCDEGGAKATVIEKVYEPLAGVSMPELIVGGEGSIPAVPLNGDDALGVRALLPPDDPRFDFAVNTMEYQPGASLSMVEVHVMEHGLLMLEGGGIYRLGDGWYPVEKGDFIWMGPYCPQWFGALGKTPAKYLIYKDINRHPLSGVRNR